MYHNMFMCFVMCFVMFIVYTNANYYDGMNFDIMNFNTMNYDVDELKDIIKLKRRELFSHPLYTNITTKDDLRKFMEIHVFAVWDFMSLVKKLQRELTSVDYFWNPKKYKVASRMINEIILNEETDDIGDEFISHFELYIRSMNEIDSSTHLINNFVNHISNDNFDFRIRILPSELTKFVNATFSTINSNDIPFISGYFYYGREDPIPTMFSRIIENICDDYNCTFMRLYLQRHINLDADKHGPMSITMISEIVENNNDFLKRNLIGGICAIQHRINLWNFILLQLKSN